MRRFHRTTIAIVLGIAFACLLSAASAGSMRASSDSRAPGKAVPGELIMGFEAGVSARAQRRAMARAAVATKLEFKRIRAALVSVPVDRLAVTLSQLRADPRVRYVERNYRVYAAGHGSTPSDPAFHQQWALDNFGQTVNGSTGTADADIDAKEAWTVTRGNANVVVSILDTGFDLSHPDLAGNTWVNPGEDCTGCRSDGVDNDGNGYVDDWRGWDFVSNDNNPNDDNGHGTHVAGIIGAVGDNGVGLSGVNWDVQLMPLKFLDAAGSGTTADAVEALLYATANGADVTNNSWADAPFSQAMLDAIQQADAADSLFVAAAGNDGLDRDTYTDYPAAYDAPNVVVTAATDSNDARAWFSGYGARTVDLGTPGVNVYSTWRLGNYRYASGTSMATPHVAGAAALAKAALPGASDLGLKALLLRTTDANASLTGRTTTGGRLNANTATTCSDEPVVWLEGPAPGFAVSAGRPVALRAIATKCGDPAGVAVTADANGQSVELTSRGDGLYSGVYTPADAGPLTLTVSATTGALTDSRSVSGSVLRTVAIEPGGPPVTITAAANENLNLTFAGTEGRRVALRMTGVTIGTSSCCSTFFSIQNPDGTNLLSPSYVGTSGAFMDTKTLPASGVYTILVDPQGTASGSMTLTLYDVPPDAVAAITPAGPSVTVTTDIPGQNAKLLFNGTAGQRIAIEETGVTIGTSKCCSTNVSILKPDGTSLASPTIVGTSGGFIDAKTLPASGVYTILVDPQSNATGSMTLTLYDVPPDAVAAITPAGPSVTVTTDTPGQNARLPFNGTAGQRVVLEETAVTIGTSRCCSTNVSILKPDGTSLASPAIVGTSGGFIDVKTLPVSGVYTLLVDPQSNATGSMTLTLHEVPPDTVGSISLGGASVTATTTAPGQNAKITFTASAGQRVSLELTEVTIGPPSCCSAKVSILRPNGTSLVSGAYVGTSGSFVDTKTITLTGTHTILVDPQGMASGSVTLKLHEVPVDAGGTLAIGGGAVSFTVTTPGQNARLTFSGTAGRTVTLTASGVTIGTSGCCSTLVSVLKPDGMRLVSPSYVGTNGRSLTTTLPVTGTYAVVVDPQGTATGGMMLTLG
jgi:subtilisin family serine protease